MRVKIITYILTFIIILTFCDLIVSRTIYNNNTEAKAPANRTSSASSPDEIVDPPIDWPVYMAMMETEQIQTTFSCNGRLGTGYLYEGWSFPNEWDFRTFASPYGSDNIYLFAGALWIGGIVGDDTLVSVGMDGWSSVVEMWPNGDPPGPTITKFDYISDLSYRTEFYDTSTSQIYWLYDDFDERNHIPLNLKIVKRGHIWRAPFHDMTVIFDMVITNIGGEYIEGGYIGLHADADIYHIYPGNYAGYYDDLSGSIRSKGIAYTIDNDGEPDSATGLYNAYSPIRAYALKFLYTSFVSADTNFNWWISSGNPLYDYGPRLRPTEDDPWRDFERGLGTPNGDCNKYYLMSHSEWDFDQIMTATVTESDPVWTPTQLYGTALDCANGYDTRFTLSTGPFSLPPDSSIRVLYAAFTAESIHTDPDNFRYNYRPDFPELYYVNLNFDGLMEMADTSLALAEKLLNPDLPVTGLQITHIDNDSTVIKWDPYVFPEVEGYSIYLTEHNPNDWPYRGVMPPWFKPDSLNYHASIGPIGHFAFDLIPSDKAYYINVANQSAGSIGDPGKPVLAVTTDYSSAPGVEDEFVFAFEGGTAEIEWTPPEGLDIDYYNIYKFINADSAEYKYSAFYDDGYQKNNINPKDSFNIDGHMYYYYAMEPFTRVDSGITTFTDIGAVDGNVYVVAAVNKPGFESSLSDEITFNIIPPRNKDILVIISKISKSMDCTYYDSILVFYDSILQGYNYDIYNLKDTTRASHCPIMPVERCIDWHDFMPYNMIIMEDGLYDNGQLGRYEQLERGLTRYLLTGGTICYFGMPLSYLGITVLYDFGPEYYPLSNYFMDRFFGIDSVMAYGLDYYFNNSTVPYVDSIFGFTAAEGVSVNFPDITYDADRWPFYVNLLNFWPTNTGPLAASFKTGPTGEAIQIFRSLFPVSSILEGEAVGVYTETEKSKTYIFGYHLWYMNHNEAGFLIDKIMSGLPTDISDNRRDILPKRFELSQNYPNPFNLSTTINYSLKTRSHVRLAVYNILGQKIKTIVDGQQLSGDYSVNWNGTDVNNNEVASGIYFYQLQTDKYTKTKKMVLLK